MEMTVEKIDDTKGWLRKEDKKKVIEELRAFEGQGGSFADFAQQKGVAESTLYRYIREVEGSKGRGRNATATLVKVEAVKKLMAEGKGREEACKEVGIKIGTFAYWYYDKSNQRKKYAPRVVKQVPNPSALSLENPSDSGESTDRKFNKQLSGRISALEKLVVELSLDKQALIEAVEGAR